MSKNSSSPSVSPHPHLFFNGCLGSMVSKLVFTSFTITNVLIILPLSIIVLHLGHQRWRRQHSALTSHTDLITFHMAVMEIIYILASIFYCIGSYIDFQKMMVAAVYVCVIVLFGQMSLHTLTCMERYLAVIHPITYMHLRKGRVRIRNIIIWCVWLLGFVKMSILGLTSSEISLMVDFAQQACSLAITCFCSLAVLRVLKRPGPGEGGGDRERVDQSKQRAFNTIMAIMGTLLLRSGGGLVSYVVYNSSRSSYRCVVLDSIYWLCLPSSLVLPLLFLHRAGKLPCCQYNTESGQ